MRSTHTAMHRWLQLCLNLLFLHCPSTGMASTAPTAEKQTINQDNALGIQLLQAVKTGDITQVQRLITAGAPIDARDNQRYTPLMRASIRGYCALVQLLLNTGAQVELRCDGGYTALALASSRNYSRIVALLLAAGASAHTYDNVGYTPLSLAAEDRYAPLVHLLLAAHAEVNASDQHKRTPLHWAAWGGHRGIVKQLLTAGAEVDIQDEDGYSPLMDAIQSPYVPEGVVRLLLNHAMPLTMAERQKLDPDERALIDKNNAIAEQRSQAVQTWIDSLRQRERLPRDITRLICKIAGERPDYMPLAEGQATQ